MSLRVISLINLEVILDLVKAKYKGSSVKIIEYKFPSPYVEPSAKCKKLWK